MLDLKPYKRLIHDVCPRCDTDAPGGLCDCHGRAGRDELYVLVDEIEKLRAENALLREVAYCGCAGRVATNWNVSSEPCPDCAPERAELAARAETR